MGTTAHPRRWSDPTGDDSDSESATQLLPVYPYSELKRAKAIRLLLLLPGGKRNGVVCELIEYDLGSPNDGTKYEALSWAWGVESWASHIQIRHENKFYQLRVPPNLLLALKALRQRREIRTLWADAICINQSLIDEKSVQVPLMTEIYGKATRVSIWLGPSDSDSKLALDFIKYSVLELHNFHDLVENPAISPKWRAMLNLMQRPWFSRRWVVQEIALSHDATIYCGSDEIAWRDFAGAVQLVVEAESSSHSVSQALRRDPKFRSVSGWFDYISSVGASLLVDASRNLFRNSTDQFLEPLCTIEYLVSTLHAFDVSEPRDAIYALLALAKDTTPVFMHGKQSAPQIEKNTKLKILEPLLAELRLDIFPVDYTQSYVDVCQQFIYFCISRSSDLTRALDILCRPWAPAPKRKAGYLPHGATAPVELMPTWIPPLSGAAYSRYLYPSSIARIGRQNADSLVGSPGFQKNYSAAGVRKVNMKAMKFKKGRTRHSMFVRGFILDSVGHVDVPSQNGYIPNDWLRSGGWTDLEREPPEDFWRTLVADRDKGGGTAPIYGARAVQLSVVKGQSTGYLNTVELINEGQSSVISEFFRRVQAVTWNRRLMRTRDGRLGIVRQEVRPEDLICILYGCSVPVILRRCYKDEETKAQERMEAEAELQQLFVKTTVGIQRRFRSVKSRRQEKRRVRAAAQADVNAPMNRTPNPYLNANTTSLAPPSRTAMPPQDAGGGGEVAQSPLEEHSPQMVEDTINGFVNGKVPEVPDHYYEFLGECYVHGMMDGEAIRYRNSYGIPSEDFDLR